VSDGADDGKSVTTAAPYSRAAFVARPVVLGGQERTQTMTMNLENNAYSYGLSWYFNCTVSSEFTPEKPDAP
jgi:hypothetical protein